MNQATTNYVTLNVHEPATREVLMKGKWKGRVALPLSTSGSDAQEKVLFELVAAEEIKTPPTALKWFLILRAYSLSATGAPCLATMLYGLALGWKINTALAVSALIGAVLLQIAINILNDVQDHLKLIDLPGNFGGSGALQKGWITALELNRLALISVILAAALGAPAVIAQPAIMLPAVGVAGIGVLGYSNWPFRFKYRALGDVAVVLMCGPLLTYCYSLAAFGTFDPGVLILGWAFGLAAGTILHANNLQDIPVDQKRGAKTMATRLPFSIAKKGLAAFYLGTYFFLILGTVQRFIPWPALAASAITIPLAFKLAKDTDKASGPDSPLLSNIRVKTAQTHLLLGVVMSIGFGVSIFFGRS